MPGRQREKKKIEGEKQCKIVSYQIEKKITVEKEKKKTKEEETEGNKLNYLNKNKKQKTEKR